MVGHAGTQERRPRAIKSSTVGLDPSAGAPRAPHSTAGGEYRAAPRTTCYEIASGEDRRFPFGGCGARAESLV